MPKRLSIIHISDVHISEKDWDDQRVVVASLMKSVRQQCDAGLRPDLVVISGDLVDKAEEWTAYELAYEKLIEPLLEIAKVSPDNVVLCPGNHDASRAVVDTRLDYENTLRSAANAKAEINQLYRDQPFSDHIRTKFANFLTLCEMLKGARTVDIGPFHNRLYFKEHDLVVDAVNSASLTRAGHHMLEDDERRLVIPEALLTDLELGAPNAKHRVLVTHHPLSSLLEANSNDVQEFIGRHYTLHLFGHVHSPQPITQTSPLGTALSLQAGALFSCREKLYMGYSVVSLASSENFYEAKYFTYWPNRREFDVGTNVAPNGLFYGSEEAARYWHKFSEDIDESELRAWIINCLSPNMRQTLNTGLSERPVDETFVPPPLFQEGTVDVDLETGEQKGITALSYDALCAAAENFFIFGGEEYGKTTLLQQIGLHYLDEVNSVPRPLVPILIPFKDIKPGTDRVRSLCRANVGIDAPASFRVDALLEQGHCLLLVDDVDLADNTRLTVLNQFLQKYPRNRFVFTGYRPESAVPTTMADGTFCLPFARASIGQWSRRGLRADPRSMESRTSG